jgi:AraC-like DNA-binding protein
MDACDGLEFACIEKVAVERVTVTGPWAWDVRVNQLSPGSFHSKLQILRSPSLALHEQYWQRSVEVVGTTSKHAIMIGASLSWRKERHEWCGTNLDNRRFACAAPGTAIDFKSPEEGRHIVMQVKPDVLFNALGPEAVDQLLGKRYIEFKAVDGQRLTALMTGVISKYAKNAHLVEDQFFFRSQKSLLLKTLGDCIANAGQADRSAPGGRRKTAVRKAIKYLESHDEPVTALELAVAAGVSQRTMEYAFREKLEMTPAAYLRIYRLNAAHRELLAADPKVSTVTSIALKWGFSHPGRFSVIHRKMFNETPSEALSKVGV